ncbi:helix-turn-helix domain-containing protein [Chryseobacterium capnotolerans]|nr:transposase [Chryseobacterium capnotolerans]UHO37144.1 helix-turn-helix domain-containing protein [Chryseobacterium capnotolerans]
MTPNYKQIYIDFLDSKKPEKKSYCMSILSKTEISALDIIDLNKIIFGNNKDDIIDRQRHKAYDKKTIFKILDYQKKQHLNNKQLATHFKLSRNTVAKWKKIFLVK